MMGNIYKTTDYREYFVPYECEFCQLDTGGNHAYYCPNNPDKNIYPYIRINKIKEIEG